MRFSIKTLLVLLTLAAVAIAMGRYAWGKWPVAAFSVLVGVVAAFVSVASWRLFQVPGTSGTTSKMLAMIAVGMVFLVALNAASNLAGLVAGCVLAASLLWARPKFGGQLLTWLGIEHD